MRIADYGLRNAAIDARVVLSLFGSSVLWFFGSLTSCGDESPKFTLENIRGRVVFLAEAMEKRGVPSAREAKERILALQTTKGELVPLLEDARGRAFRSDERLRRIDVELLVRRYALSPVVQVINVSEVTKDGKFVIDYWCEICSIAMYELKDCDCCQGPVELRRQKVQ
jgi:hypothetical protein